MGFATEKKFGKIWHEFPNENFLSGACDDSSSYKGKSKVKNANIFFLIEKSIWFMQLCKLFLNMLVWQ